MSIQEKLARIELKNREKFAVDVFSGRLTFAEYKAKLANPHNLSMRWYPRLQVFKSNGGKLIFNPTTGEGTSYHWYSITKVIKGKLVLNNYPYSNSTSQHINKLVRLFRALDIDCITCQAPKGLQDLNSLKAQHCKRWAEYEVDAKYARKARVWAKNAQRDLLDSAKDIGVKITKRDLAQALIQAEASRAAKLARKRAKKQKLAALHRVESTVLVEAMAA